MPEQVEAFDAAGAALWAPHAWMAGRWQSGVILRVGADGCWAEVTAGIPTAPPGAIELPGPALPGLVNAHSHAFQRAFAGLAERREAAADDFWSWRDRMYGVARRINADQLRAVAAQLQVELLRGGYTQVCEFHYLQHRADGRPHDDPAELAWAIADAAQQSGIGLTLLPVLYERAGFAQPALRVDQARFATTAQGVWALQQSITNARRPRVNAGVAVHSLRAASPAAIDALRRCVGLADVPVHVHVAEQTREVDDCLAATGQRPIEWLCRHAAADARWQLVHATHATPAEIDAAARCGAGVVICPSTEGNLGDGLPDLPAWFGAGVGVAIGSDSHVTRCWAEELRWLEYGQRLLRRQRNVAAAPALGQPASAARLFDAALAAGGRAAGLPRWGFEAGARADALVLDTRAPGLLGVPASHRLDALVFATDAPAFRAVYVAGRRVVDDGAHVAEARIAAGFENAMAELWGID